MAREHKLTHPVFGVVTWKQLEEAREAVKAAFGRKVCSWCHSNVPAGARTRCGKKSCDASLHMIQSWRRCAILALRRDKRRCQCGRAAEEVDHIVPVSLGGTGDLANLRSLCGRCHKEATRLLRKEKGEYVARKVASKNAIVRDQNRDTGAGRLGGSHEGHGSAAGAP